MSYKEARNGAALAGTLLIALPILDFFLGVAGPGVTHAAVGVLGLSLLGFAARLR